jgi:hypothetical protein
MIDLEKLKREIEGWQKQWDEDYPLTTKGLLKIVKQAIIHKKAFEIAGLYYSKTYTCSLSQKCEDGIDCPECFINFCIKKAKEELSKKTARDERASKSSFLLH